ncbi:MAG: hypothetical protein AAGG48_30940 [Planctomycetota bacterium]
MSGSENSGRIRIDEDVIRYTSHTDPDWTLRVADIRIFGEATNQHGAFADDYFLCFATGLGSWHEASFYANGREHFLSALSEKLGVQFRLQLTASTDFASRILWPVELVGKPMFKYEDVPPKTWIGRLIGTRQISQTYADHVLSALK